MCEQICEFDFAMWEKDCELARVTKKTGVKHHQLRKLFQLGILVGQ